MCPYRGILPATRNLPPRICVLFFISLTFLTGQACGQSAQSSSPAPAQSAGQRDLSLVPLEDLMNIEVTSVSKKEQKMSQAAAAIFVITQEDIQPIGGDKIPDLLRMVPGLDVSQINANSLGRFGARLQRPVFEQIAGSDRWARRLHPAAWGSELGYAGRAAGGY